MSTDPTDITLLDPTLTATTPKVRFTITPSILIEDTRLNRPYHLSVYLALDKFTNAQGFCFPCLKEIARLARCGVSSVKNAINDLTKYGYLTVKKRFKNDGSQASNGYFITKDFPNLSQNTPEKNLENSPKPQPAHDTPPASRPSPDGGGASTRPTPSQQVATKDNHINNNKNNTRQREESEKIKNTPPQKTTSKKSKKQLPSENTKTPDLPHDEEFTTAWNQWIQHRKELRKPLTNSTQTQQLKKLSQLTAHHATSTILFSIEKGYTGLFPENENTLPSSQRHAQPKKKGKTNPSLEPLQNRPTETNNRHHLSPRQTSRSNSRPPQSGQGLPKPKAKIIEL